jgi:hypothetical protein
MNARKLRGAVIDSPSEADTYETKLRDGDLVIAYVQLFFSLWHFLYTDFVSSQTDGLSDNVFPTEIIAICSLAARSGGSEDEQVQTMADRIVDYARQCMVNYRRVSPFESTSILFFSPVSDIHRRKCSETRDVLQRRSKSVVSFQTESDLTFCAI